MQTKKSNGISALPVVEASEIRSKQDEEVHRGGVGRVSGSGSVHR